MNKVKYIFNKYFKRTHKIGVYALVGKAGTGKSFRARLIAEKQNISMIIDDGLLIRGQTIVAGRSAKREKNKIKAIKRAIFEDPVHAEEVRTAIEKENVPSILIIGTSEKMIARITDRLNLRLPMEIIYIEDVATEDEITRAKEIRRTQGKHVIPVPVIEVKKDPSHQIIDSLKLFLKKHPVLRWKKRMIEKTIVQPHYHRKGRLMISEAALGQLIMHCVQEYNNDLKIKKIVIDETSPDYHLDLRLVVPYGLNMPEALNGLQEYIVRNVERFSGVHIAELHLTVDQVKKKDRYKID